MNRNGSYQQNHSLFIKLPSLQLFLCHYQTNMSRQIQADLIQHVFPSLKV